MEKILYYEYACIFFPPPLWCKHWGPVYYPLIPNLWGAFFYPISMPCEDYTMVFRTKKTLRITTWPHILVKTDTDYVWHYWSDGNLCFHLGLVIPVITKRFCYIKNNSQTRLNCIIYPHSMHLKLRSSKMVELQSFVVKITSNIPRSLFSYVVCKMVVVTYVGLFEILFIHHWILLKWVRAYTRTMLFRFYSAIFLQ